MAKRSAPTRTLSHDFDFARDTDVSAGIAVFQIMHAHAHDELLIMEDRRQLRSGKVRVTFQVRPANGSRSSLHWLIPSLWPSAR